MSTVNLVELNTVVKEEPFNHEDKVESTGNADLNWKIKLETEDYNLEDLHHVIDIKDEVPLETHNQEIESVLNHQSPKSTKRKLPCSFSEEDIISVVSKKPTLWNPCDNNYGCGNTLSVWQDVAQELGVSGEGLACRAKWDSIQKQYKNFKQSGENRRQCKYVEKLSFLDPYLSFSQKLEENKSAAPYLLSAEQKLNRKLSNDSVTTFFLSIENTVRKLPPDLQIEAKRNIFNVIANCELLVIKQNSNQKNASDL